MVFIGTLGVLPTIDDKSYNLFCQAKIGIVGANGINGRDDKIYDVFWDATGHPPQKIQGNDFVITGLDVQEPMVLCDGHDEDFWIVPLKQIA